MKIYFDGGCRPNPGVMEIAVVVRGAVHHVADLGFGSSEMAEWLALLHAVDLAATLGVRDIVLLGDAIGVVNQAMGKAKCRNPALAACRNRFEQRRAEFDRVRVRHVARNQNLAGIALVRIGESVRYGRAGRMRKE